MSNEASVINKYASDVFAGLVSATLDVTQVSAVPVGDPLVKEDVLVHMEQELKRTLE